MAAIHISNTATVLDEIAEHIEIIYMLLGLDVNIGDFSNLDNKGKKDFLERIKSSVQRDKKIEEIITDVVQ